MPLSSLAPPQKRRSCNLQTILEIDSAARDISSSSSANSDKQTKFSKKDNELGISFVRGSEETNNRAALLYLSNRLNDGGAFSRGFKEAFYSNGLGQAHEVGVKISSYEESHFLPPAKNELRCLKIMGDQHAQLFISRDKDGVAQKIYLTQTLRPGKTLTEQLKTADSWSFEDLITIAIKIAQAIQATHEKGLIHQDIKPDNIMLEYEAGKAVGEVHLIDYGFAQEKGRWAQGVCGTATYASPEMLRASYPLTPALDWHSFSGVLAHLLFGNENFLQEKNKPRVPADIIDATYSFQAKDFRAIVPTRRHEALIDLLQQLEGRGQDKCPRGTAIVGVLEQVLADYKENFSENMSCQAVASTANEDPSGSRLASRGDSGNGPSKGGESESVASVSSSASIASASQASSVRMGSRRSSSSDATSYRPSSQQTIKTAWTIASFFHMLKSECIAFLRAFFEGCALIVQASCYSEASSSHFFHKQSLLSEMPQYPASLPGLLP